MSSPEQPSPGNERRAMPRHLRDGEHEIAATTALAGGRAEDAASPRLRGRLLWTALVALAAAVAWWLWI